MRGCAESTSVPADVPAEAPVVPEPPDGVSPEPTEQAVSSRADDATAATARRRGVRAALGWSGAGGSCVPFGVGAGHGDRVGHGDRPVAMRSVFVRIIWR
nr:hypothetical protein GCM10025699_62030 [Microbacterium flavescens]